MLPSTLSDNYQIGEVLGVGTVGTIYRAVDRRTEQPVAIKKLHPTVSADRLIRARFRREMLILDRLHHPNIIRFFGGGEDNGQLYYVMELVEGGTVKELLMTTGRLQWPAVVEVGRQLCSALQFAHNHGVIHRDLKPGNLFLTTDGVVKLGDFGIARDLRNFDITISGMTVGTHAYMAPEQIRGDVKISGKADLYSLGCCLFEMLTGRTPFVGDNFAQLFEQHLRAEPPMVREFLPECPIEMNDIIQKMLAKEPEQRPFNARQIQAVMIRLDDSLRRDNAAPDPPLTGGTGGAQAVGQRTAELQKLGTPSDVGSEHVEIRGREILQSQIQQRLRGHAEAEVSWSKLGLVIGLLGVAIALAMLLQSQ